MLPTQLNYQTATPFAVPVSYGDVPLTEAGNPAGVEALPMVASGTVAIEVAAIDAGLSFRVSGALRPDTARASRVLLVEAVALGSGASTTVVAESVPTPYMFVEVEQDGGAGSVNVYLSQKQV